VYLACILLACAMPFLALRSSSPHPLIDDFLPLLSFPLLLISIAHRSCFFFLLSENMTWWFFLEQQLKRVHLATSMYSASSAAISSGYHDSEANRGTEFRVSNMFISTETKAKIRVAFAFLLFESVALIGPRSIASIASVFVPSSSHPWKQFAAFPSWYVPDLDSFFMPRFLFTLQLLLPMLFVAFVFVLVLGLVWTNFSPLKTLMLSVCWSDIMSMFSLLFIHSTKKSWEHIVITIIRYGLQSFVLSLLLTPLVYLASLILSYRRLVLSNRSGVSN
ncbi:MAG: hypothetical protein Q8P67_12780, partial [archaeon]|nr:hypothetical protein [archaeon]